MNRVVQKRFTITAASGIRTFNCLADGLGEFASANDYLAAVQVIGNRKVFANLDSQDKDGFVVSLESKGRHIVPQPHDASVQPVDVIVTLTHVKRDPMTFNVDTLKGSFVTSGNGTDTHTVGP